MSPSHPAFRFPFPGRWLIRFDPQTLHRRVVLIQLDRLIETSGFPEVTEKTRVQVVFEKHGSSCWQQRGEQLNIRIGQPGSTGMSEGAVTIDEKSMRLPAVVLKKVRLCWHEEAGDRRWRTMGLPPSHLYLGMHLRAAGFEVEAAPVSEAGSCLSSIDLLGISLYEDLAPETIDWLERLDTSSPIWVAAGGPMVTLDPAPAWYHFPRVNLMIRGEGEEVLPRVLAALQKTDIDSLFQERGIALEQDGLMLFSAFDQVNRPAAGTWIPMNPSLDFIPRHLLEKGLEFSFSRGCRHACLFCSRPHGRIQRRLSAAALGQFLDGYADRLHLAGLTSPAPAWTVNINDDDFLQDSESARIALQALHERGFYVWGLQTSLQTLISPGGEIAEPLLSLLAEKKWYVNQQPLLWIGTDVFLSERGKRLGKPFPPRQALKDMFSQLECLRVDHFHYWIASDEETDWPEFIAELKAIHEYMSVFSHFGLLSHAPFLIPYRSTPVFANLIRNERKDRVKHRLILQAPREVFRHPLVRALLTAWPLLNQMLANEKDPHGFSFFEYLKKGDWRSVWMTIHHYIRQERLQSENPAGESSAILIELETEVEEWIADSAADR